MFGKFNHDQPKLLDKSEGIQHFSLRKLSVGLASVALATTFLVAGPGQAKAETTDSSQQTAQVEAKSTTTGSEETDAKQVAASASTVEAAAKSVASSDENGGVAKKSEVQSDASDKTADGSTTAESENKPSVSDAKNADAEKTDNKNDLKVTGLADYKANQTVKGLAESKAAVKPAAKLEATAAGANTEDKVSVPVYFVDSNFNEIDSTVRHSISGKVGTYWNSSNATDDDLSQLNIPDKLYNAGWRYSEQTYDSSKDYKTSFFAQDDLYQKSSIQTEPTKFSTYWFSTNSSNDGLYVKLVHGQEDVTKEHLNDPKIAAVRDYKVVVEKPDGTQQAYDQSFGIVYGQVLRDRVSPNKLTYKEGLRGNKGTFGWAAKDADGNWEVSDTPSNFTNTFAMYGNSYTDWVNQIQKLVNEGKLHGTDNYGNTSSLTADDAQSIIDEIKGALTPEANQFYQGWLAK